MHQFKTGWKQSSGNLNVPKFTISPTIERLGASAPTSQYIIPEYAPIFNQLSLQSCTANATIGAFEILMGIQNPATVRALSRLFVYWNTRLLNKDTGKDDGGYIHYAFQSLKDKGVCLETTCPYNVNNVFNQPEQIAYKEGDDNTINSFYQILSENEQRGLDIEAAIKANHPVVFGTQVGADLENYNGDPSKVFNFPTSSVGGHAMCIVGVRRNPDLQFYVRNSWGSNWGLNGHFWMSSSYMYNVETADIFVPTLMPNLLV